MTRVIVGILRGGTSREYDLSLKTGAAMMRALPEEKYETRDILIDKSGLWHLRGMPSTPVRALSQVDVVLNALHGGVGEDGSVQRLLERSGTPYAGSRPLPSGLALNKVRAREILTKANVRMPRAVSFSIDNDMNTGEMAKLVFEQFGPPYLVKPPSEGAGHGIEYAQSILELPHALGDVLDRFGSALVEEFIRGKEVSIGVIEGFRNEDLYALPPALVDSALPYLNPSMHSDGSLKHLVPSPFAYEQKLSIADIAKRAHKALELSHFSRADLIVTPRAIYLLEVNAIPGLYPGASFPTMLESVGSSVGEFLEHEINLARRAR
ncbi:MAG: ATP-grasp domain-containing protein [Candidatus Kaiserbacteria bacterium]|nr:ATP-grasp domain-containing protein [Candidatus Kaiserbacteria bacterium]